MRKIYQVEIFRGRRCSFFIYNVRQAARPAHFLFLVTFTCTSAIFVYWKTYFSTKSRLPTQGVRILFSFFWTQENSELMNLIFWTQKSASELIKNNLCIVEFFFLSWFLYPFLNSKLFALGKKTPILLNSKDCVLASEVFVFGFIFPELKATLKARKMQVIAKLSLCRIEFFAGFCNNGAKSDGVVLNGIIYKRFKEYLERQHTCLFHKSAACWRCFGWTVGSSTFWSCLPQYF